MRSTSALDRMPRSQLAVRRAIRRALAHRAERRDAIISMLGHDLRNPLAIVSLDIEALAETLGADARHARALARMRRGVERMDALIGELLELARGNLGGGRPAVPAPIDLGALSRDAVEDHRRAAPGRRLQVETRGDLRGRWDGPRVAQALGQLLSNAVKYGDDPITVDAWEADDHSAVLTRVRNRGPVIPAELVGRIFDAFAIHARSSRGGGLGLGLYIVDQIARAHRATCEVTSSATDGTAFTIRWPRLSSRC